MYPQFGISLSKLARNAIIQTLIRDKYTLQAVVYKCPAGGSAGDMSKTAVQAFYLYYSVQRLVLSSRGNRDNGAGGSGGWLSTTTHTQSFSHGKVTVQYPKIGT